MIYFGIMFMIFALAMIVLAGSSIMGCAIALIFIAAALLAVIAEIR